MTDSGSEIRRTTEKQREAIESGQRAMVESMRLPFDQLLELQRGATELVLNGLETQEETQRRTVAVARSSFNDYLDAVEQVSESITGAARTAVAETADTQRSAVESGARELEQVGQAGVRATQSLGRSQAGESTSVSSPGYREGAMMSGDGTRTTAGVSADTRQSRYQGGAGRTRAVQRPPDQMNPRRQGARQMQPPYQESAEGGGSQYQQESLESYQQQSYAQPPHQGTPGAQYGQPTTERYGADPAGGGFQGGMAEGRYQQGIGSEGYRQGAQFGEYQQDTPEQGGQPGSTTQQGQQGVIEQRGQQGVPEGRGQQAMTEQRGQQGGPERGYQGRGAGANYEGGYEHMNGAQR